MPVTVSNSLLANRIQTGSDLSQLYDYEYIFDQLPTVLSGGAFDYKAGGCAKIHFYPI